MLGAVVGSFFLSFSFHAILWIYIGFSARMAADVVEKAHKGAYKEALQAAVRAPLKPVGSPRPVGARLSTTRVGDLRR